VTNAVWDAFHAVRTALAAFPLRSTDGDGPFRSVQDPRAAAIRSIRKTLGRAGALVRFEIQGEQSWPFYRGELSKGAPRRPTGPLLPGLVELRGRDAAVDALIDALERLAVELVYEADAQEYIDARNTSIALLYAAGAVIAVERDVIALARSSPSGTADG
jgi:hypothetical protein